jgi:hypothetical protein
MEKATAERRRAECNRARLIRRMLASGAVCEACRRAPFTVYRPQANTGRRMVCRSCADSDRSDRRWQSVLEQRERMRRRTR